MDLPEWMRHLTYHPIPVKVARLLRINRFLRDLYCRVAWSKGSKKSLSFGKNNAQFYVNSPLELRILEAVVEKGIGEHFVLTKLLHALLQGDVAYDIGASLGTHTIFMAKMVGEKGAIIAFEPEAESYETLKANISLNGLKNVLPINSALGDCFEEARLYSYGGGFGSFNLAGYGEVTRGENIEIVPGDHLVQIKKLPIPKVVKIDVEGYEFSVIRGLQKTLSDRTCQMVCCEIHPHLLPKEINAQMVITLLKSYGFGQIEDHPRGETSHLFCYKG